MAMSICVALTGDAPRPAVGGPTPPAHDGARFDDAGGKARSLVRLADAGLPVPAAFAIGGALFRALRAGAPPLPAALRDAADLAALDRAGRAMTDARLPDGFVVELDAHLNALARGGARSGSGDDDRPRYSVRSSFEREDRDDGLGAGVYASVTDVARADVGPAITRVLASALSPGAIAYAHAHGDDPERQTAAILVHRYLRGDAAGSAAWDPSGGEPPVVEVAAGALDPAAHASVEQALRRLGAREGAVEIEWVATGANVTFLQLRRYRAPPSAEPHWMGAAELGAGDWRWDLAHNPLPLSPAQAGLVALVDARCRTGIRQRVAGGYLFFTPDSGSPPAPPLEPAALVGAFEELRADLDRRLAAAGDRPSLQDALELFVAIYGPLFGTIQIAARRAIDTLAALLRRHLPAAEAAAAIPRLLAGVESLATERQRLATRIAATPAAAAEYLDRFGDEAPVWDVAVPTYREDPSSLRAWLPGDNVTPDVASAEASPAAPPAPSWQVTAAAIAARLPAPARASFDRSLARARAAAAIGEDDDVLYARAQAAVRAALLREGARLAAKGVLPSAGDVCWLPFETVRQSARGDIRLDSTEAASMLAANRTAYDRALREPPRSATGAVNERRRSVRGKRGSGGRVIGPAFVHRSPTAAGSDAALTPESIIVARTLLPTELPLLRAAGLVVESGGVLGHVAAQARERGIPALVDAPGACALVTTGDLVLLDADAGQLIKLG
jgi:phosphohistidine swiveling domain-containing protein